MSLVQQHYNDALDRLTGMERIERTFSLFGSMCQMLSLQVSREFPNISDHLSRVKIAERLYVTDKLTQNLLMRVSKKP